MVACVGSCDAAHRGKQKITSGAVRVLLILLICLVSFPSDWLHCSLCVMAFGTNRGDLKNRASGCFFMLRSMRSYIFAIDRVYGILQMGVALAAGFAAL